MNRQCPSTTQKGNRCTGAVPEGKYHCLFHDPANTDKRRRIASKGGKGKKSQLSKNLHPLLEDLTERVINGDLEPIPPALRDSSRACA